MDLAVTSFCIAVKGIHDPQIYPNMKLKAVNEIHSPMVTFMAHLTRVTVSEVLDRGLRLTSSLASRMNTHDERTYHIRMLVHPTSVTV